MKVLAHWYCACDARPPEGGLAALALDANCLPRIILLLSTMFLIHDVDPLADCSPQAWALKHQKKIFHHDHPRSSGSTHCYTRVSRDFLYSVSLIGGHMYTRFDLSSLHTIVDLK
jgi:hypothetical protein